MNVHRSTRSRIGRLVVIPLGVAAIVASACSSTSNTTSATSAPAGSQPGGTTPGTTPGSTPGAGVANGSNEKCVKDIDKVIATKPTAASTTAALPAELVTKLDAAAQSSFTQAAAPGAIVGVRTHQGTWTKAYGDADPAAKMPMATDMHTRIGSVTKTFTGTMLLQLAEQGKLSLDDPIEKYVPGVTNGNRVTLRMLANMTSGVASYTQSTTFTDRYFARPEVVIPPDELLKVGLSQPPLFEPGAKFNYSNTNTVLLGKVIEKVSGKSINEVFDQGVLKPLALTNTSWPGESSAIPTPYPQGYTLQGLTATPDKPTNATNWNPAWGWTAGEMISSVNDLLVYGRALGTGQGLLTPATQAQRLDSFPGASGYGLAIGCIGGWVGHTGELPGYNTTTYYDTTSDTTVIVMVNSDIASGNCELSDTLTDDPRTAVCSSPATRMFVGVSGALGHEFQAIPSK